MAKTMTAAAVQRLRTGKDRREVRDGGCPGLHLIIQATGAKSWALRFRGRGGKQVKLTLGPLDLTGREIDSEPVIGMPLTLAAARRLATEIHRQRAMGNDVVSARRRERLERDVRGSRTFAQAAVDFVEQHSRRRTRTWKGRARLLGIDGELGLIPRGLADRWSDRPVADISGDDVHGVIDEVRERGIPGLERRVDGPNESRALAMFAALSKMFRWLVERRRLSQNPCIGVHRPPTQKSRDRVLSDAEIVKLWKAADAERVEFSSLLKVLLLTGQRLGEVGGMRRSEISDDGSTWTIPGERTKNKRVHVVALAPLARSILASVPTTGDIVFTTDGRTQLTCGSKIKARLDAAMTIPPWRFHDLRRTAATGMATIGIMPHVVEAVLNHVSGARAGVAGTYNRAAYAAEKRAALERWADHVETLVTGRKGKVTPIRRKAS